MLYVLKNVRLVILASLLISVGGCKKNQTSSLLGGSCDPVFTIGVNLVESKTGDIQKKFQPPKGEPKVKYIRLLKGNDSMGMQHILTRHGNDYEKLGLVSKQEEIGMWLRTFLDSGWSKHMKTELRVNNGKKNTISAYFQIDETKHLIVAIAAQNGFIITAYPKSGLIQGL